MANRICSLVSYKQLVKHIQSTTPTPRVIVSGNKLCFFLNANATLHTQGDDPFVGAVKATTEVAESVGETVKEGMDTASDATNKTDFITETTTAEADTNVVDTVEYRSSEDLQGQLGDGYDNNF